MSELQFSSCFLPGHTYYTEMLLIFYSLLLQLYGFIPNCFIHNSLDCVSNQ